MAGVDAIVTGTITELGSYVAINCRMIETETGEIFAAAKAKIKKDKNIIRIMKEVIKTKETKQENIEGIKKGIYDAEPNETIIRGIGLHTHFLKVLKVEVDDDNIIINICIIYGGSFLRRPYEFLLEEAYILDNQLKKHYLLKTKGLKLKSKLGRYYITKRVVSGSRTFGFLYFPRFELTFSNFLLYTNGYEIKVNLLLY